MLQPEQPFPFSEAKVAWGFDGGSKVKRQSRHGNNLHPHASGSILPMNLASDSPTQKSLRKRKRPPRQPTTKGKTTRGVCDGSNADGLPTRCSHCDVCKAGKQGGQSKQAGTDGARVFTGRKYRSLLGNFPSRIASNAENSPIRQGASPSAHPIGNSFLPSPKIRRIIVSQAKKERIFIWDL